MYPTFVGLIIFLCGLPILFARPVGATLALMLACGPMGGSAALVLPALGGSSIPPIDFALGFAIARLLLSRREHLAAIVPAIKANWPLLAFVLGGIVLAYVGPRLFQGQMDLPTLRSANLRYIYQTEKLRPSSQNITTSVYLIGTFACAVFSYYVCSREGGWSTLVKTVITVAWVNVGLGVASVVFKGTPLELLLQIFRNGSYAQLDQEFPGFVRITGIFPETSSYSAYVFIWFSFLFECWLRDVMPRRTGPIALAMFAVLVMSTSSSAYVSLAVFGLLTSGRLLLSPSLARSNKLATIALVGVAGLGLISAIMLVKPSFAASFGRMLSHMTLEKSKSISGMQRAFWAKKGWEAFKGSYGIGVGPGSFRSSSLITAILGSSGFLGFLCFAIHIGRVLKPLRSSTYSPVDDPAVSTGIAASWAVIFALVPLSLASPTPDPGADFAILCGAALALRAIPLMSRSRGLLNPGRPRGFVQPLAEHF